MELLIQVPCCEELVRYNYIEIQALIATIGNAYAYSLPGWKKFIAIHGLTGDFVTRLNASKTGPLTSMTLEV